MRTVGYGYPPPPPPPSHIVAKALQGLTAGLLLLALSAGAAFAPQAVQAQGSVPPAPTDFSASPRSGGGVTLRWKMPGRVPFSTNEPHGITRWEYSQKTSGSPISAPWTVMTGSNIRVDGRTAVYSYDVSSGIIPGNYVFTVRAINSNGNGAVSSDATSGTGLAKPRLSITAVENSITLRWTAPTDASITRWEYRFKNKERSERAWFPISITGSEASTRTVTFDKSTTSQGGLHGGVGQYQVRSAIFVSRRGKDVRTRAGPWSDTAEVSIINTDNLALVFGGSPVSATGTTSVSYNASVARDASVTYTVALSKAALPYIVNPVVVTLTSSDTGKARVSPSTLTFTADNAETPQMVTVTGVAAGSATIGHAARFPGLALIDPAGTITVTVLPTPPKPTNFSASPRSGGGVTLRWKIPGRLPLSTSEPHGIIRWEYSQKTSGSAGAAPWTVMTGSNIRFDRRTAVYSYDVSSGVPPGEYVFTVRAVNSHGNGAASDEATSRPGLDKPTGLRITAVENSITLRWTAEIDASITRWEYRFKNKERGERGWRPFRFQNSEASTRTATLDKTTTLHGGVGQYRVRSVNPDGAGPWSDTAEVSIINTDNLALVFGGSPVSATGTTSVSYTASVARNASVTYAVAVSEAALLYVVNPLVVTLTSSDTGKARVSPSTLTFTADNAETPQTVTLTGVAAGSATIGHAARFPGLALIDPAGTIAVTVTEPVTVTLPAKPTGFGATVSGTQVALAWTDPGDASITGWQYRQKVDSGHYGTWTGIPGATATTTGLTVTGLRLGSVYTYQVRAVNTGGSGPASDEATATIAPAKPLNLRASAGPRQVTLSWRNPRVASITGWQYRQKAGTGNYGGWTNIPDATATTTRHTVPGLTASTAYTFELRAVNAGGNSPASDEAMATPTGGVPAAPTGLRVTAAEDSVTLNWTAYTDSTITGWRFQAGRVLRNSVSWGSTTEITGSAASTRTHTIDTSSLVDGVQYRYRVDSVNADGSSDWSTSPVVGIVNSDNLAMTLSASTLSVDRGATVSYTVALTDAAVPGSGVNLSLIPTSSDTATATVTPLNRIFTQSTAKTPQSFTVTGVKPGRATISHSIELVSPDRRVVSSGKISVTVTLPAPAKPGNFSATAGDRQVALSWDDPDDESITKYQYRQKIGAGNYGSWTDIDGATATTTRHTVTGLRPGVVYAYRIRAVNRTGNGTQSDEATATPTATLPALTLSGTADGTEGGSLSLTLTSDFTVSDTLDVAFTVQGSTSTSDRDAAAADFNSGTLTGITSASFQNARTATVSLPLSDDGSVEGDEGFRISLAAGSGYLVDPNSGTLAGTLTDNDGIRLTAATGQDVSERGTLTLALSAVATTDGGTSYSTDAGFSGVLGGLVWAYAGGTAVAGDFSTVPDSATFSSGTASVAFTVADDTDDAESYSIQLASVTGHAVVAANNAVSGMLEPRTYGLTLSDTTLTVTEGDAAGGMYTVALTIQPSHAVTVTVGGFADTDVTASPATLTFSPASSDWSTPKTVTVTAEQDLDAVDDRVALTHTAASSDSNYNGIDLEGVVVTVDDDDDPGVTLSATTLTVDEGDATGGMYTVVLATQPSHDVTVTVAGFTGTDVTANPATLSFTSGVGGNWSTAQTVTVTADQDLDAANDSVTLTHSATSTDGDYNTIDIEDVVVTVDDDDTPAVTPSTTTLTVNEGDSAGATYLVALATQPSHDVTVTVSGFTGTDVTASPATLSFTSGVGGNWSTAKTVTVTADQDLDADDDSVTLTHSATSTDGDYNTIVIKDVVVTVDDDDTPAVTLSATTLTVEEGDTAGGSYTVVLATQPDADVTVTVAGFAGSDVTASPATLTFSSGASGNWNMAQSVTVTAAADSDLDADSVTLRHTASGATGYSSALDIADVDVSVTDTTPGVLLSATTLTVEEGDSTGGTYTVVLNTLPDADVTVTVAGFAGTDVTASPAELTFTSGTGGNWDTARTVTVTAREDDGMDDESVTLRHTASGATGYSGSLDIASVVVTVDDDDAPGVTPSTTTLTVNEGDGAGGSYTVVLDTQPDAAVTVSVGGFADTDVTASPATLTFSTTDWDTVQRVTVTAAVDSDTADDSVTLTHSASGATGYSDALTIADVDVSVSDTTPGQPASVIATAGDGQATLFWIAPGTGGPIADWQYRATTQSSGWSGAPWTEISGSDATTTRHTVSGLSNAVAYRLQLRAIGSTGTNNAGPASEEATVTPTATPVSGVTVGPPALSLREGGSGNYVVVLNARPDNDVLVTVGGATAKLRVQGSPLTFSTADWALPQTVTVTAVEDDDDTADESVTLTHTVSGYGSVTTASGVSVTVTDNDRAEVTVAPRTLSLAEGTTGVYTLVLNTRPANAVLVTVGGATAKLRVQGSPLTFSTTDWASPQTVTVLAQQDADGSDERVTLTHAVSGYGPVTTATSVVVSITDDDEVTEQTPATRAERVNQAVLPHVVESITAGTLSAVTGRIDAAIAGTPAATGNALNLAALAARYGQTHASGTDIPLWEALNGTRFALPLSAAGEGGGALPNLAIWGSSNWLSLSGSQATGGIAWDGGVWGTALGADLRLRPNLLAGVSISHARGSIDTTVTDGSGSIAGDYDTRTTSVYPYLAWSLSERLSVWVTGGYGKGRLEIKEADAPTRESDLDLAGGAAGGRGVLLETTDLIHGGVTRFAFTGEGAYTQVKVAGGDAEALPELEVDTHRLRLAMQGSHEHGLPDGSSLHPAIEVGMRHDGGSGDNTGFGVETGGTLSYLHPALGLTLELRGRTLLEHEADRNEWGIGGLVRIDPNTRGRGLFLSLAPSRGSTASRIAQPYQYAGHASAVGGATGGYRLDAELGHGFGLRRHGTDATLTPYVGMALSARDAHSFRLGGRYHIGAAFKLDLEALRRQHRTQRPDHSLLLRGTLHW